MRHSPRSAPIQSSGLGFVLYTLGLVYMAVGSLMLGLGLIAFALAESAWGFLLGGGLGMGLGFGLRRIGNPQDEPKRAEALLAVASLWLLTPALGAIPFWVSGGMAYLDALFEAMSGFTTTGATVLADFAAWQGREVLFFWRSLMQWLGGIGILALFIVVLPHLAVAGRQLFFAESSGVQKDQLTPKLRHTALFILRVYGLLTGVTLTAYVLLGMPWFEALCNALSTVPAGGFSPNAQSFASYSAPIQWVAALVMFLTGVNLLLQYRVFFGGEPRAPLRDPEFRAYGLIVLLATLGLATLLFREHQYGIEGSLRHALFQVAALITGTGFASADFAKWVVPAQIVLIGLMFIGGSAGSVSGSIKVVRWLVAGAIVRRELQRVLHPQAVLPLRIGNKNVGEDVLRSVASFITLYTLLFASGAMVIGTLERDFVVALTASAAAIGNIGPGLGPVGPMAHYGELHPVSKLVMIFQMWAGRIELIAVFVLFTPELWRRLRG